MIFVTLIGCVEPFQFSISNVTPPLVIESFISNASYNDCVLYPSDGRFFKTTLRYGQKLFGLGEYVIGASVSLLSDQNESWQYTEVKEGNYELIDLDFKAVDGKRYKLNIVLPNQEVIESSWEILPEVENTIGEVSFEETTEFRTSREKDETFVKEIYGIDLTVDIPKFENPKKTYFKWKYESTWIYLALRRDNSHPLYRCWVNGNKTFLTNYNISESINGGYVEKLAFIPVQSNERFWNEISILVKQYAISKGYYEFLNELNAQSESSDLFASPPYNLTTNYSSTNSDIKVFGYFSVRLEEAKRIYLSMEDFTYTVSGSDMSAACDTGGPFPAPDDPCRNCLYYPAGEPSLSQPWWW